MIRHDMNVHFLTSHKTTRVTWLSQGHRWDTKRGALTQTASMSNQSLKERLEELSEKDNIRARPRDHCVIPIDGLFLWHSLSLPILK